MDGLWQDFRYALRRLAASPGFTLVAVLSLGLGIGANTAIFSVVNAVLVRRAPMEDPGSLVEIYAREPGGALEYLPVSWADRDDFVALDVFEDVTGWEMFFGSVQLGDASQPILGELVAGNFFDMLGVQLVLGRGFTASEDLISGRDPVVVISHAYWQERFGGAPDVLGETIRLDGRPFTVVGVAAPRFTGMVPGLTVDLWVPSVMGDQLALFSSESGRLERRGPQGAFLRGRLRPGTSSEQAQAAVSGLLAGLVETYPEEWSDYGLEVIPTLDVSIHPQADKVLMPVAVLLMSVVGMVLLIACTNLASFLLARAADRKREVALRLALGAGRGRLVRQFLTETTVLALAGGAVGLAMAQWTLKLAMRFQPPTVVPVNLDVGLDRNVFYFALAASALTGLLFGLLPALQATKPELAPTLKDQGRGVSDSVGRSTLRSALVVLQVAVSLVLLVGSSLFVRSLVAVQAVDPGFRTSGGALLTVDMSSSGYDREAAPAALARIEELLLADPAIDGVALADRLPLSGTLSIATVSIPGYEDPEDPEGGVVVDQFRVGASYLDVMGIPLLAGRGFQRADDADAARVAVISESMALRYWPGDSPLGRTFQHGGEEVTVVGVAADTKVRSLRETSRAHLYFPLAQRPGSMVTFVATGRGQPAQLREAMRTVVRDFDAGVVVMNATTLAEQMGLMLFGPRVAATLLGIAGALALLLAAVGLYGVVGYSASRRTREMGIRISMGADAGAVTRMVVGEGLKLVLLGSAAGLLVAFGVARLAGRYLYGVGATDPLTFLGVPLLLAGVAAVAAYVPARRAGRVNPVTALRSD